jgi:hemerythrin superfamily protein
MDVLDKIKSWLPADAATDIRAALQADHREVRALAEQMAEAGDARTRKSLFATLKPLLTAHARAEEAVVYQAMVKVRRGGESKDLGNEGFVEHSLVDVLLERLSKTELAGSDAWKAHATVLKEMLDHHVEEEESEFFEAIGEHFDDRQRREMAEACLARKTELLGIDDERDQRRR